jgi:polygalacturonase
LATGSNAFEKADREALNMFECIYRSSRSLCLEDRSQAIYFALHPYDVVVNGKRWITQATHNVVSLFGLEPKTSYRIQIGEQALDVSTLAEAGSIDVTLLGAKGDGVSDDTKTLQSAIDTAPFEGRVFIPAGRYLTGPLYLRSHLTIEFAKGAVLLGKLDRKDYPILPVMTTLHDGSVRPTSSWEGVPEPTFASLITGIDVENVHLVGEGILDGQASLSDWWVDHKRMQGGAWRPKTVFLSHCKRISLHGVHVENSPSWTIHPYFSQDIDIIDLPITNPKISPNTDGCNPESSKNVRIIGVDFSVGDDCIAIKSGKFEMGMKYRTPSENITIRNCRMRFGHGAVVLGSEMSGGIRNLSVTNCLFVDTDRGLRVKTRRGRGESAVIDGIYFENIKMEGVLTPLVINMFYNCDPLDGKTEYVYTKEALPIDSRTPYLGQFTFRNIVCIDVHVAAGYFYGLPEQPIGGVTIENVSFAYAKERESGYPAMMCHIDKMEGTGLHFHYVDKVVLRHVEIHAPNSPNLIVKHVKEIQNSLDHSRSFPKRSII